MFTFTFIFYRNKIYKMPGSKDKWKNFQKEVSEKRSANGARDNLKKVSTIMVQKMNPIPTGKQKKYDPERARDFVDFSKYSKLSLENVKAAYENFFGEPTGSCDVLYSDRGPSCNDDAQLSGKKVILIRIIASTDKTVATHDNKKSIPADFSDNKYGNRFINLFNYYNLSCEKKTSYVPVTFLISSEGKASKIHLYRGCIKGWQTCYSKAGDCQ